MAKEAAYDVGEEVYKVEEDTAEQVVEEAASHMKIVFIYHMSPMTLSMHSGTNFQTRQGRKNKGPDAY